MVAWVPERHIVEVNVDGRTLFLQELSAKEAFSVWDRLASAEQSGDKLAGYLELLSLCLRDGTGARVADDPQDLAEWPSRIIIPLGVQAMDLCELGLDLGEAPGDRGSDSVTSSRSPSVARTPTVSSVS